MLSHIFEHSKYGTEKVREQSTFAKSIISQNFMSFVFIFLDYTWYITALLFLLGLDHVSLKPYLLEGNRLQWNVSYESGMKRNKRYRKLLLVIRDTGNSY